MFAGGQCQTGDLGGMAHRSVLLRVCAFSSFGARVVGKLHPGG